MPIKRDKNGKFASTGGPKGVSKSPRAGGSTKGGRASGAVKAASAAHKSANAPAATTQRAGGVLGKAQMRNRKSMPQSSSGNRGTLPNVVTQYRGKKNGLAKAKAGADSVQGLKEWLGDTPAQKRVAKRKTTRK